MKEEKYLAPQIVFYLTKKVNDYFRKLHEFVKLLGFSETPNIYWTNLVKCEGRKPSDRTKDMCYGRFLEEELQALKEKWIIAVSGEVYQYLSKKIRGQSRGGYNTSNWQIPSLRSGEIRPTAHPPEG